MLILSVFVLACSGFYDVQCVSSYYKWTLKVSFSGQLYIALQTTVVAYMNQRSLVPSEGQPYSGWIRHKVHTTQSLIIIHCRDTHRAAVLKHQHLLWLPLTLCAAAIMSLSIIKMTCRSNICYFLFLKHCRIYVFTFRPDRRS